MSELLLKLETHIYSFFLHQAIWKLFLRCRHYISPANPKQLDQPEQRMIDSDDVIIDGGRIVRFNLKRKKMISMPLIPEPSQEPQGASNTI